ncbi:MAG: hypothetical protein ACK4OP_02390, partial [Gemmobacter sp.]
ALAEAMARTRERIAALEAEAVALVAAAAAGGRYGDALDYARVRAELMVAAQRDGRQVTPELAAEIDRIAEAYMRAGAAAEDARRQVEDLRAASERGADAISDIFADVLTGARSANDAIADLLVQMARIQMQDAFRMLASSFGGGGGIFGLIGRALGARAGGGPVEAGMPYLVNENTARSEVFVPSRSGAVLNVPQAQAALRGIAQGGAAQAGAARLDVRVYVDETGHWQAAVGRVAAQVVARAAPGIVQSSVEATYAAAAEVPIR